MNNTTFLHHILNKLSCLHSPLLLHKNNYQQIHLPGKMRDSFLLIEVDGGVNTLLLLVRPSLSFKDWTWYSEIDCEEFQKLLKDERDREDIMLMKLAEDRYWRRCPTCRFYVERTEGCRYITCRWYNFCVKF